MNDPHVKAIHYFIEHDDSVDYSDAAPLVHEDEIFVSGRTGWKSFSSRRITMRSRRRPKVQSKGLFAVGNLRRLFAPALPHSS